MNPAADLVAIVEALRARGVAKFKDNNIGIELEFFPAEPQLSSTKGDKAKPDEDKCRCGHFEYEHADGLCLKACDPTLCAPETK